MKVNKISLVVVSLLGVLLGVTFINPNIPKSLPSLVRQVDDSVVKIEVDYMYGEWSGTGVIISEDGTILTAGHVVDFELLDDVKVTVTLKDGTILEVVDFYKIDNDITDVGILKVDPNGYKLQEAKFVGFKPEIGEKVFAIGEPYGIYQYVTSGIISALNVDADFFGRKNLLMTDTPLNPGNSGCPLFNMKGQIVAILVGGIGGADGIGFCIPAEVCIAVINIYNANKVLEAIEE